MGYKCKPITERAKSSPFKINMALVSGAATSAKRFTDAAGAFYEGANKSTTNEE